MREEDLAHIIKKQGLTVKQLEQQIEELNNDVKTMAEIIKRTQPILGRLIATFTVLKMKGLFTDEEMQKITNVEASNAGFNPKAIT